MKNYTEILIYIQHQLQKYKYSLSPEIYLLKQEAYQDIINYINTNFLAPEITSLGEYQVDYSCPDRVSFIESIEKNI